MTPKKRNTFGRYGPFFLFIFLVQGLIDARKRNRLSCFEKKKEGGDPCDGCGSTECFRVTHKSSSGQYLCTHTHTHSKRGRRVEWIIARCVCDGRVTGEPHHQHILLQKIEERDRRPGSSNLSNSIDFKIFFPFLKSKRTDVDFENKKKTWIVCV